MCCEKFLKLLERAPVFNPKKKFLCTLDKKCNTQLHQHKTRLPPLVPVASICSGITEGNFSSYIKNNNNNKFVSQFLTFSELLFYIQILEHRSLIMLYGALIGMSQLFPSSHPISFPNIVTDV